MEACRGEFKQVWRSPRYITREKSFSSEDPLKLACYDTLIKNYEIYNMKCIKGLFVHSRIYDMHLINR